MSKIGFIGVGNMGGPMARNLIEAGHQVTVFDLVADNLTVMAEANAIIGSSTKATIEDADVVITMLPAGKHVKDVYLNEIFQSASKDKTATTLIDCSTIDVATSREVHEKAKELGFNMIDAPVSGGVGGASAGTLTFMVGGSTEALDKANPYLEIMGKNIVHCGDAGNGQVAKMCNNMMLGIQMASVAEAFTLAEKLGLEAQSLFDVASTASGQCWSLTTYCPAPGPVKTSPANNNYEPGFANALMLKDMMLALDAAQATDTNIDVAVASSKLYEMYSKLGNDHKDFSGIFEMMQSNKIVD